MKTVFFLSLVVLIAACSKDKISTPLITADCPDTVKFGLDIFPIINQNCMECHGDGGTDSPKLKDYTTISSNAESILKAIKADGLPLMPNGGPALDDSLIQKITCWIQQGKLNN